MQCDMCGQKKASVHLTEIVNDQVSEMHLCEKCAKEKSIGMEQQFGLADLLAGLSDFGKPAQKEELKEIVCDQCGLTYDEFKKMGRLGCNQCYDAFAKQLVPLLKKIHGSCHHQGKSPKMMNQIQATQIVTVAELRERLHGAIANEDFEKAAELRDHIRELEEKDES